MIDHRTEMILKGVAWSIGVISFLLLTYAILENNSEPIEKFQVVDQVRRMSKSSDTLIQL
jgi:hypothetical protein